MARDAVLLGLRLGAAGALMSAQATIFEPCEQRRELKIGLGDVAAADDADLVVPRAMGSGLPVAGEAGEEAEGMRGEAAPVGRIVVLEHEEVAARGGDRRPQRLPVDGAGADIGPAVVDGDAAGGGVLDVEGDDLAGELLDLGRGCRSPRARSSRCRARSRRPCAASDGRSAASRRRASHTRSRGCARRA